MTILSKVKVYSVYLHQTPFSFALALMLSPIRPLCSFRSYTLPILLEMKNHAAMLKISGQLSSLSVALAPDLMYYTVFQSINYTVIPSDMKHDFP